jgi:glutathione peroxidase
MTTMILRVAKLVLLVSVFAGVLMPMGSNAGIKPRNILDFTMKNIDGKAIPLSAYKGKVLLVVNVASECGNTPQYEGLEALYRKYKDRGFALLAFPANNFGGQEPGTDTEIKNFCQRTYSVSFDLFSKISVKGKDQHPFYSFITSSDTNPKFSGDVQWNFQKYLVDRSGTIIGKFEPSTEPFSKDLVSAIEAALK